MLQSLSVILPANRVYFVFLNGFAYEADLQVSGWPSLTSSFVCNVLNTTHSLFFFFLSNWPHLFFSCSFSFWRENGPLCVLLLQMSHSTKPVTMFGLYFAGCGLPWHFSHTYHHQVNHPHSGIGSFSPIWSTLSLLFAFLSSSVGRIKDTFSVWRRAWNFLCDLPGTQQTTRLLRPLCMSVFNPSLV